MKKTIEQTIVETTINHKDSKRSKLVILMVAAISAYAVSLFLIIYYLSGGMNRMSSGTNNTVTANSQNDRVKNKDVTNTSSKTIGGEIQFNPQPGVYKTDLIVRIKWAPLKSAYSHSSIQARVYYTLDGSEPSKNDSRVYSDKEGIVLDKSGIYTINAKVISDHYRYQGKSHSVHYTIDKKSTRTAVVTDAKQLDQESRKNIFDKTKHLIFEISGKVTVKKEKKLILELSITKSGKVTVTKIDGIIVEPKEYEREVLKAFSQNIEKKSFNKPTKNGENVDARISIDFHKISYYYKDNKKETKIILERK